MLPIDVRRGNVSSALGSALVDADVLLANIVPHLGQINSPRRTISLQLLHLDTFPETPLLLVIELFVETILNKPPDEFLIYAYSQRSI